MSKSHHVKLLLSQQYWIQAYEPFFQIMKIETVVVLSKLINHHEYWEKSGKLQPDGSFYKTKEEITSEIRITRKHMDAAQKELETLGILIANKTMIPGIMKWTYLWNLNFDRIGVLVVEATKKFNDLRYVPEEHIEYTKISTSKYDTEEDKNNSNNSRQLEKSLMINDVHPGYITMCTPGTATKTSITKTSEKLSRENFDDSISWEDEETIEEKTSLPNSNSCESNLSPEYSIKETKTKHPGSPLVLPASIPSVDQIRRSWESNSIPLDSFSPQKDRLPLLRDLISTLNSFGYKENDLPRSFPEQVTSHWWSKAKKKDQRESMKQNSLTDYDRALVIFQEEIKIVSAKPIESPKEVIHQPTQTNKTFKKAPNRSVEEKLEASDKCLSYTDFDELDALQRRNLAFKMDLDENDPIITKIMEDQYK